MKDLTKIIFKQIEKECANDGFDFGLTETHYGIGRIDSLVLLESLIGLLNLQNDYEVFIETQRIDDEIKYYVSGERKNV